MLVRNSATVFNKTGLAFVKETTGCSKLVQILKPFEYLYKLLNFPLKKKEKKEETTNKSCFTREMDRSLFSAPMLPSGVDWAQSTS